MTDWYKVVLNSGYRYGVTISTLQTLLSAVEKGDPNEIAIVMKIAKDNIAEVESIDIYEGADRG